MFPPRSAGIRSGGVVRTRDPELTRFLVVTGKPVVAEEGATNVENGVMLAPISAIVVVVSRRTSNAFKTNTSPSAHGLPRSSDSHRNSLCGGLREAISRG
jgi:hypothetical protein